MNAQTYNKTTSDISFMGIKLGVSNLVLKASSNRIHIENMCISEARYGHN